MTSLLSSPWTGWLAWGGTLDSYFWGTIMSQTCLILLSILIWEIREKQLRAPLQRVPSTNVRTVKGPHRSGTWQRFRQQELIWNRKQSSWKWEREREKKVNRSQAVLMAAVQSGDPTAGSAASSVRARCYFPLLGSLLLHSHDLSLYFLYSKGPHLYRLCSRDSLFSFPSGGFPSFCSYCLECLLCGLQWYKFNSLFWTLFKPPIPCCAFVMTFTFFWSLSSMELLWSV